MAKGGGRTNKLRYGAGDPTMEALFGSGDSLFKDDDNLPIDEMEDVYEIDVLSIGNEAHIMATSNIQNLLRCYNSKEFVEEHPDFKRRIDTEIEGLRKLFKMAKIDEVIHDHLIQSIAKNPGNASLYMSHVKLQEKILAIDKEIRERVANFNKIISSYQLELNFNETKTPEGDSNTAELEDGAVMSRGSKAFIEQMKNQEETETEALYDPDNLPPFCEVNDDGQVVDTDTGEVLGRAKKE